MSNKIEKTEELSIKIGKLIEKFRKLENNPVNIELDQIIEIVGCTLVFLQMDEN